MVDVVLQRIGDGVGLVLDSNMLEAMGVDVGDAVNVTPAEKPSRASRGDAVERGRGIMTRYRKTFEALAK